MTKPRHPLITTADDPPTLRNRLPLVITIPLDRNLPKELSPNFRSRSHWPRTNAVKEARYEACMEVMAVIDPNDPHQCFQTSKLPLTLHVVVARGKGGKELDDDNLWGCIKAYRDGIADALGVDDKHFRQGTLQQVKSETGIAYMRIAIEPSDTEAQEVA